MFPLSPPFRCSRLIPVLLPALLLCLPALADPGAAQDRLAGRVVNAASRQPLPGAQVVIEGTERGTLTDARGRFLLMNVPEEQVTLRVVMIGYADLTQVVRPGQLELELALTEIAIWLLIVVAPLLAPFVLVAWVVQRRIKRKTP